MMLKSFVFNFRGTDMIGKPRRLPRSVIQNKQIILQSGGVFITNSNLIIFAT